MAISVDDAKRKAEYELRFNIGNLPHLGTPEYDDDHGGYVFPIRFTKPELPDLESGEEEVEFYETQTIGELIVFDDGSIERTPNNTLEENIKKINRKAKNGNLDKK